MKLLLCEWGAYMQEDLCITLRKMNIDFRKIGYCFDDFSEDDFFLRNFAKIMDEDCYDAVFTLNYFPVLATLCNMKKIPYIAWVYDCPFDVKDPEKTLGFETNHVFFFDKDEYKFYYSKGFQTVHHMELGVNVDRIDEINITEEERSRYVSDISFIGNMYGTQFPVVYSKLSPYYQGYISALIDTQINLYGAYVLRDAITDQFVEDLKKIFPKEKAIFDADYETVKKWMNHIISSEITRRERISILALLSTRHHINLYANTEEQLLKNVHYCGTARCFEEIYKIYRLTKVNLNISLKEITSGIPLRVFDIMGAGGFLLTNWQPEIAENFVDGKELVMYESVEDAVSKADYYLKHEEERNEIAKAGRKAVERFSLQHQLMRIFEIVHL